MDSARPSHGGFGARISPNPRRWRLWLAISGFVLGVVPAVASWSFLLYLFHISNGAGGIPPVPTNVDPQTQTRYLVTFGYLSVFTFAASPIGFLTSLWVIILDALAGLFYPWRLGVALLSLIVSAGPTTLLSLYVIARSMGVGKESRLLFAMATPTPSDNRAAPQRAPARGMALALVSVLLVVIALVLDALVFISTFSKQFAYVDWRSPLIIAATVGALSASAGAISIGMWENRRADQTGTTHRLRAGLARASIGAGLLTLVAIAGLYGSIFYVAQACSAFPGCE